MNKPRVFVVNEPMRWDGQRRCMVRARDITPAYEFGELIFLTPGGDPPINPQESIDQMTSNLSKFNFTEDDYLLPIGHPLLIAWAAAIAARMAGGKLKLLHWQSRTCTYAAVDAELYQP